MSLGLSPAFLETFSSFKNKKNFQTQMNSLFKTTTRNRFESPICRTTLKNIKDIYSPKSGFRDHSVNLQNSLNKYTYQTPKNQTLPLSMQSTGDYSSKQFGQNSKSKTEKFLQIQEIDEDEIDEMLLHYQMRSSMFDFELIKQMSNFGLKKYKNSLYRGQLNSEGQRHGKGVMTYFDNIRVYEGDWVHDLREGEGYEKFSNLNEYKGGYRKNKPEGKGHYVWRNGDTYEGQWYDGLRQGMGKWHSHTGEIYEGEWFKGQASGYGVMIWANGDRYEGGWRNCKKHGQGEDTYAEGNRFIGKYDDGLPDGYGEYYWNDGSFYRGNFEKGHKHGQGIMFRKYMQDKSEKWVLYEGEFVNDARHGMGEIKWSNGNYYLGQFQSDERHGQGEMRWIDDTTYIGEWSRGKRHGWGTLKKKDGLITTGVFVSNNFMGKEYVIPETIEENISEQKSMKKSMLKQGNLSDRQIERKEKKEIKIKKVMNRSNSEMRRNQLRLTDHSSSCERRQCCAHKKNITSPIMRTWKPSGGSKSNLLLQTSFT